MGTTAGRLQRLSLGRLSDVPGSVGQKVTSVLQAGLMLIVLALPLQGAFVVSKGAHFQISELMMLAVIIGFCVALAGRFIAIQGRPPLAVPLTILVLVIVASSAMTFPMTPTLTKANLLTEYQGG